MKAGCDSILQTYVVQPNGNVGCCCGMGMRITSELNTGNYRTNKDTFLKDAIESAENDFFKTWIHYYEPEKILAWASEKNPKIKWENLYAHKCQACLRLYQDAEVKEVIRNHYQEVISDVLVTAFIDDVYLPLQIEKNGVV